MHATMKTTPRVAPRLWSFTMVVSVLVVMYGVAILSGPFQG